MGYVGNNMCSRGARRGRARAGGGGSRMKSFTTLVFVCMYACVCAFGTCFHRVCLSYGGLLRGLLLVLWIARL